MVNSTKRMWSKSFNDGIAYNRVGTKCISTAVSRYWSPLFSNFLPEQLKVQGQSMVAFSEYSTLKWNKMLKNKFMFFHENHLASRQHFTMWNPVYFHALRILLKPWTISFKKDPLTTKSASQSKCLEDYSKRKFTFQMKKLVLQSLVRSWGRNLKLQVANEFGVMLTEKCPHKTEPAYHIVRILSFSIVIHTDPNE